MVDLVDLLRLPVAAPGRPGREEPGLSGIEAKRPSVETYVCVRVRTVRVRTYVHTYVRTYVRTRVCILDARSQAFGIPWSGSPAQRGSHFTDTLSLDIICCARSFVMLVVAL